MRATYLIPLLLLAACTSANRSDGTTPAEAAQLNAAAAKLDAQSNSGAQN